MKRELHYDEYILAISLHLLCCRAISPLTSAPDTEEA